MELIDKSLHNIDAASCLMQGQYYTESIHCVYYACYQMLLYKIDDLFDKNERERKLEYDAYVYSRSIKRGRFLGSHDFWIKFFQEKMQENGIAFFKETEMMKSLKESRHKADYSDTSFSHAQAEADKKVAENIISKLKGIQL